MKISLVSDKPKAGDLIFFRSDGSIQDMFIHIVSPRFTHVGIFVSDTDIIEAHVNGIIKRKIDLSKLKSGYEIYDVLTTEEKKSKGISLAYKHIGEKYSIPSAMLSGLLRVLGLRHFANDIDSNWFCSEFISYILRLGMGLPYLESFAFVDIFPDDMLEDPLLKLKYKKGKSK